MLFRSRLPSAGWAWALRPDAVEVLLRAPEGDAECVEGRVAGVAWTAGGLCAHVRIDRMDDALVARVDGRRLDADDLTQGRRVWCTWQRAAAAAVRLQPDDENR